jgi:hypothetical protein
MPCLTPPGLLDFQEPGRKLGERSVGTLSLASERLNGDDVGPLAMDSQCQQNTPAPTPALGGEWVRGNLPGQ